METILLDEDKLDEHITTLEDKRDEYSNMSAEWYEINDQIKEIKNAISHAKI
jgi:hypothetical protein